MLKVIKDVITGKIILNGAFAMLLFQSCMHENPKPPENNTEVVQESKKELNSKE